MLPAVLELITNKSNTIEVGAHSEPLIFFLDFPVACALLCQGLVVERQSQHDVRPNLPSMKCAVKASKLHRMVAVEEAVKIEKVISAAVVMLVTTLCAILRIPDALDVRKGRGFGLVHLLYQPNIHFLAVAHSLRFDL